MDRCKTTDELKTGHPRDKGSISCHRPQEAQSHLFSRSLSPSSGVSITVTDLPPHTQLSPVHALLVLEATWASEGEAWSR